MYVIHRHPKAMRPLGPGAPWLPQPQGEFQIGGDDEVAGQLGRVLSKEVAKFFALNLPKTKRASGGVPKALENKQQIGCGGQI